MSFQNFVFAIYEIYKDVFTKDISFDKFIKDEILSLVHLEKFKVVNSFYNC